MATNEEKVIASIKNIPMDQLLNLDYFKNRGLWFIERALIDDAQGRRELAFSDAIKDYADNNQAGLTFADGLDEMTVLTTFQWLTTNVGGSVLSDALRATGRKIVDIKEK